MNKEITLNDVLELMEEKANNGAFSKMNINDFLNKEINK